LFDLVFGFAITQVTTDGGQDASKWVDKGPTRPAPRIAIFMRHLLSSREPVQEPAARGRGGGRSVVIAERISIGTDATAAVASDPRVALVSRGIHTSRGGLR
jgi:hypothetical protein